MALFIKNVFVLFWIFLNFDYFSFWEVKIFVKKNIKMYDKKSIANVLTETRHYWAARAKAAEVEPCLGAPAQQIYWPGIMDFFRQYDDDDKGFLTWSSYTELCKRTWSPQHVLRTGKVQVVDVPTFYRWFSVLVLLQITSPLILTYISRWLVDFTAKLRMKRIMLMPKMQCYKRISYYILKSAGNRWAFVF